MSFPKPPAITDTSAWLTKDPSWVEARKLSWRGLAPALFERERRKASETKALETYYLTGKNRVPLTWDAREFPSIPLLFRLWFHPDRSQANWDAQVDATTWADYDASVRSLRAICDDNGPGVGGFELRLYDVFLSPPGVRRFLETGNYLCGDIVYEESSIESYRGGPSGAVGDLGLVLEFPGKNPHLLGRYAIRRWLTEPEHPGWTKLFDEPDYLRWTHRLFHLIRYRVTPEGSSAASSPEQVELAQELRSLFDEGRGPERFQRAWKEHERSGDWRLPPPERR